MIKASIYSGRHVGQRIMVEFNDAEVKFLTWDDAEDLQLELSRILLTHPEDRNASQEANLSTSPALEETK